MVQQEYDLRLDSYPQHLEDIMKKLLSSEEFADVTLVCDDGKHIKAHRNILSICSPVLKNILQIDQRNAPIIYLRGINHYEMKAIIKFIYLGQASVLKTKVDSFLQVADNLKIKELTQMGEERGRDINDAIDKNATNKSDNDSQEIIIDNDDEEDKKEEEEGEINEDTLSMDNSEAVKEDQKLSEEDTCDSKEETVDGYNEEEEFNVEDFVDQTFSSPEEPEEQEESKKKIKKEPKTVNNQTIELIEKTGDEILDKTCDECGKVFAKRKNMAWHKITVHSKSEYPCNKCLHVFTRPDRLRIHIQSKHIGTKFSCPHCQKEFNFQTNCTAHIKSVHEKVKYDCSFCNQKYTDRATLRRHVLREHTESKPTI